MTSAAEHRRPVPSDGDAILNALPNPVLLIGPDGKIVDANMAAESFFEISTTSVAQGARAFRQPAAGPDRPGAIERLAGQ
jgi:nitrogen-specific signal transduction histidine kinase